MSGPADETPRRLAEGDSRASELLSRAAQATARPPPGARERVWRAMHAEAGSPRRAWVLAVPALAAAAIAIVVFIRRGPNDAAEPAAVAELAGRVEVEPHGQAAMPASVGAPLPAEATVRVRSGGEAVLSVGPSRAAMGSDSQVAVARAKGELLAVQRGAVAVLARRGLRSITVVAAGPYFVQAESALFVVHAGGGEVVVLVDRGDVIVRTAAGDVAIAAGASWSSAGRAESMTDDDKRLALRAAGEPVPEKPEAVAPRAEPAPAPVAPVVEPPKPKKRVVARVEQTIETDEALHARAHEAERQGRYAQAAQLYAELSHRGSARAEPALYELARVRQRFLRQPAAALDALDEYARRYPGGSLSLEAALTGVEARLSLGDGEPALRAMDDFLQRFGESERAGEVRWLRASLLVDRGECAPASAELRTLAAGTGPHASDALFALASCARAAGSIDEARTRLEDYLRRFPDGPRREDAERALRGAQENR